MADKRIHCRTCREREEADEMNRLADRLSQAAGCGDHLLVFYYDPVSDAWMAAHQSTSEYKGRRDMYGVLTVLDGAEPSSEQFERAVRVLLELIHQGRIDSQMKVPGALFIPRMMRVDDLLAAEESLGLAA